MTLATTRLALEGVLVLQSATPQSWFAATDRRTGSDLAPGRPLHAETWIHLLTDHGFHVQPPIYGGGDRRLDRVAASNADATAINAAIDTVNTLLLGRGGSYS